MGLHNAERIQPEWQDIKVGDTMWMSHPRLKFLFPETKVAKVDPNKALVFAIYGPEGTEGEPSGAWSFILEPIDETSTRLISRLQVSTPTIPGKVVFYAFMEPAHYVMQQGMFYGLKERIARAKAQAAKKRLIKEATLN